MFNTSLEIIDIIESKGHSATLVGGCVRDFIMDIPFHDIDIATSMTIDELKTTFKNVHSIGRSFEFGIVCVNYKGFSFEVAQYRSDSNTSNGRHPDSVKPETTFEVDCFRRDFTICALGIDVNRTIIDYVGGIEDIQNKIIRTVGNPHERFNEDFLRMLRAVRFAGRLDFTIEPNTLKAIQENAHNIHMMSAERIKDELFKMASLSGVKFARCIELLDETGLLVEILPEIKTLQNFQESVMWHPEAFIHGKGTPFCHTLQAIKQNKENHPLHNLCVLFHDIGKGVTHEEVDGKHRFHSHDAAGVELFHNIVNRLKFSNHEKEVVLFSIQNHMKLTHVREMKKSKVAKLVTHEHFPFLKNTIICDDSCREEAFNPEKLQQALTFAEQIKEVFEANENKPVVVNGKQVMELLNIKPGPMVGQIIKTVTERVLDTEEVVCIKRVVFEVFEEIAKK